MPSAAQHGHDHGDEAARGGAGEGDDDGPAVLRFRLVRASSHAPEHPADELVTQSPHSRGWLTAADARFPQELVLDLRQPARLSHVQLLSHESKIASRLDLAVSMQDPEKRRWKHLGYMVLGDNEETAFEARELLSVNVSSVAQNLPCRYVRIVVQGCHPHKLNPGNQVGIIGLNILGRYVAAAPLDPEVASGAALEASRIAAGRAGPPTTSAQPTLPPSRAGLSANPILVRLDQVRRAKQEAASQEDYGTAQRLKKEEAALESLARQIRDLEARKHAAVQREDFETAQRIKADLDALVARGEAAGDSSPLPVPATPRSEAPRSAADTVTAEKGTAPPTTPTPIEKSPSRIPAPASGVSPARSPARSAAGTASSPAAGTSMPAASTPDTAAAAPHNRDVDKVEFWSDTALAPGVVPDKLPTPEKLPSTTDAGPLLELLHPYLVRCLYSSSVSLRAAALAKVEAEVQAGLIDPSARNVCEVLVQVLSKTLSDGAVNVKLAAAKTLSTLLEDANFRALFTSPEFASSSAALGALVVDNLADSNARVRQTFGDISEQLAEALGSAAALGLLTRASPSLKRSSTLWRPVHARLTSMQALVEAYAKEVSPEDIMQWVNKSGAVAHANAQVRDAARALVTDLYALWGEARMRPLVQALGLRARQAEEYEAAFVAHGGASGGGREEVLEKDGAVAVQQPPISTTASVVEVDVSEEFDGAEGLGGVEAGFGGGDNLPDEDDEDYVAEPFTCPFCLLFDEQRFATDRGLDMHFWKECAMLTGCPQCEQVIEIPRLNEHLLEECAQKDNHKQCPRCGEAIAAMYFDQHVQRNSCLPAPAENVAQRCPLCHRDIGPFEDGWHEHLLEGEGCPKNPRGPGAED